MMRRMRCIVSLCITLGVACTYAPGPVAGPQSEAFRAQIPKAGPAIAFNAPKANQTVLSNGLTVLSTQQGDLPLVHMKLVIAVGAAQDQAHLAGLTGFLGEALKSGTQKRSAIQIAEEVEALGTSIHVAVDADSMQFSATMLRENFERVFDVLADMVQHTTFNPKEIERIRRRRLAALIKLEADPHQSASRLLTQTIFGAHPYGHTVLGDAPGINKVNQKNLVQHFKRYIRPDLSAMIIVGQMSKGVAEAAIKARLGSWMRAEDTVAGIAHPLAKQPSIVLVDKRDAPQSQLRIGHLGVSRDHDDYFPLVMLNAVLGGMFSSRINMNLREDKGFTYGARSAFDFRRFGGAFVVATGVRTDVTDLAIKEILNEIQLIRTQDIKPSELQAAKNQYSLSLPGYFQSVGGVAGMLGHIFRFKLPLDYYQQLPNKLAAVTIADVKRVAQKHLRPQELSIVVVGDRRFVEPGLADLHRGPIELRHASGQRVD